MLPPLTSLELDQLVNAPTGPFPRAKRIQRAYGATTLQEERVAVLKRRLSFHISRDSYADIRYMCRQLMDANFVGELAFSKAAMTQHLITSGMCPVQAAAVVQDAASDLASYA